VPLFLESEGYELRAEDAEEAAEEAASEGTVFDLTDPFSSETSTAAGSVPNSDAFELELTPELVLVEEKDPPTTEDFISELASEVEGMEPSAAFNVEAPPNTWAATPLPAAHETTDQVAITKSAEEKAESLNQLSEVFQAFRSELGELGEEDEDLEIHYNLGIAYREMGLLDEAIGELQKVAKAVQKGKPFRYAMNCAVLLALSFGDKGESKIAALWYKRALDVPGLDLEAVLALRYDLGLSLEMAGESDEALDCFRQVYAMNIDYRDVSDRIATLQHH
jgi:tetratricopeptide (TPR) repeat protein